MEAFNAIIDKIGINPFVPVPEQVLQTIFKAAGKDKGPVPVKGAINGHSFRQTLVKYKGAWRLYINTPMLRGAGAQVGSLVALMLMHDPSERTIPMHKRLKAALESNPKAYEAYRSCPPSLQKEIRRYIHHLKSDAAIDKNIDLAIAFLTGQQRWIGREPLIKPPHS